MEYYEEDTEEYLSETFVEESLEDDQLSIREAAFIEGWRDAY